VTTDDDDTYPGTEHMSGYKPGRYHPVHIGDLFQDRYCIVNNLGFGSSSTVLLVEDLTSGRFASLKILTASASEKPTELDIIRRLKQNSTGRKGGSPRQEYVVDVWDEFQDPGARAEWDAFRVHPYGAAWSQSKF